MTSLREGAARAEVIEDRRLVSIPADVITREEGHRHVETIERVADAAILAGRLGIKAEAKAGGIVDEGTVGTEGEDVEYFYS